MIGFNGLLLEENGGLLDLLQALREPLEVAQCPPSQWQPLWVSQSVPFVGSPQFNAIAERAQGLDTKLWLSSDACTIHENPMNLLL